MRIRRKSNACLNCNASLDGVYNYCPMCGQENNNNNISFGRLFSEFFSNYLSFDSRMGKSIFPFFFKPGFLTNAYNRGERVKYMHPVRLYLVISIVFFFIVQLGSNAILKETIDSEAWRQGFGNGSSFDNGGRELTRQQQDSAFKVIDSAFIAPYTGNKIGLDTLVNPSDSVASAKKSDDDNGDNNFQIIEKYLADRSINNTMLYDSLDLTESSALNRRFWQQYIRVRRADEQFILNYAIDNLPIMMLLLLPVFALILKILYFRRKILYIKHLIHAFHIHSFAYIIYALIILFTLLVSDNTTVNGWIIALGVLIVTAYSYISLLKVYKQHYFKTFLKFVLLGYFYSFWLNIFFFGELFISFLFF